MNLKDIVAVAGKSGLFRVMKPTRTGMILESIDEKKSKLITGVSAKVSLLKEISIYTTNSEGSTPLETVMGAVWEKYSSNPEVDVNNNAALMKFLESVLPDYDKTLVYPSDVKKMVNWYKILVQYSPEVFEEAADDNNKDSTQETV